MGIGGISSAEDALEFIVAGASSVQVGTASFANTNPGVEVVESISTHCQQRGARRVYALVSTAQT